MSDDRAVLEKALGHSLSGKGAHVEAKAALEGLPWKLAGARRKGAKHSIFQLVNHMLYWQGWVIRWLDGEKPAVPKRASASWPGTVAPASQEAWASTVERFGAALDELERRSRGGDLLAIPGPAGTRKRRLEMLQTIGSHNSYHVGQVVLLRQLLGAWPPPSGGLTW